jgi:4-hydroxy-3-methylbut-2-enyl diphosphate reductase
VDATCPDVKRVQDKAKNLAEEGYRVVIIGKADHPEVIGIKAYADLYSNKETIVISSVKEALASIEEIKQSRKIGIVIQTTQKSENLKKILPIIAENSKELKVHNTICSTTFKRQQEAQALAGEVELMIVVGSKSSANTTNLAEILSELTRTIHIESPEELDTYKDLLSKVNKIGVTAGASTPEFVINEVINRIGD